MCYNLCWSLLVSQFLFAFCKIPALYAQFPDFYAVIFLLSSTVPEIYMVGSPYIVSSLYARIVSEWCLEEGGKVTVMQAGKKVWVCKKKYSSVQFIAPSQVPITGTSMVTGPTGNWGDELCISWQSTTLWKTLWSGHWTY